MVLLAEASPAQDLIWGWKGDNHLDRFGDAVDGAGDVNNDGFADLIVGVEFGDTGIVDVGLAIVYSGLDGTELARLGGSAAGDRFGFSVSAAGDVDSDSHADYLIGAATSDASGTDAGSAFLFCGKDHSVLYRWDGGSQKDMLGYSVSDAGDINKDGRPDVIVGAIMFGTGSGYVRIFSGLDGTEIRTLTVPAGFDGLRFGTAVAPAGDVDGDTYPDVLVGDRGASNTFTAAGSAYVFSGQDGSLVHDFHGTEAFANFGVSVASVGDVTGDGGPDLIVGSPCVSTMGTDSGAAWVYSGADGSVVYAYLGDAASCMEQFGSSVDGAGDVNLDGVPDFLVGAPGNDMNGDDTGASWLYSGSSGTLLYTFKGEDEFQTPEDRGGVLGGAVAGAGDVNQDGLLDLIVGASGEDSGSMPDTGGAFVFSGNDLFLNALPPKVKTAYFLDLRTAQGPPGNPALLYAVDVNGTPTFVQVSRGTFDATGTYSLSGFVPLGLAGNVVSFRSFALGFTGKVIDTSNEAVTFQ